MKKLLFSLIVIANISFAQVGINSDNTAPHPSAQLDVKSSNKGLLLPRITSPASSISGPAAGLVVYDQANANLSFFNGANWSNIDGSTGNQGLYSRFPNSMGFPSVSFTTGSSQVAYVWQIPAGINQIWIEAWAGGFYGGTLPATSSNSTYAYGGDASDFASFIVNVTSGENISIAVGKGGTKDFIPGNTLITTSAAPVRSYEISRSRSNISYNGSLTAIVPGLLLFVEGEQGHQTKLDYVQAGTTDFRRIVTGGKGGDAYPASKGGYGSTVTYDMIDNGTSSNLISLSAIKGATPGAGGGVSLGSAGAGGCGYVIIHW